MQHLASIQPRTSPVKFARSSGAAESFSVRSSLTDGGRRRRRAARAQEPPERRGRAHGARVRFLFSFSRFERLHVRSSFTIGRARSRAENFRSPHNKHSGNRLETLEISKICHISVNLIKFQKGSANFGRTLSKCSRILAKFGRI